MRLMGIWNSSYRKDAAECGVDVAQIDDWHYVLSRLEAGGIKPSKLITHRLSLEELDKGLDIMHNKTEDYCKIMIYPSGL